MQNEIDALRFDVKLLQAQVLELLTWQMEMDPPQRQDQSTVAAVMTQAITSQMQRKPGWPKGKPRKVKHEETPDAAA